MQKTAMLAILLWMTCFSANAREEKFTTPIFSEQNNLEYTIVRIKYSLKKSGIVSQLFADIGTTKTHSLSGGLETVREGVFKIGFGKDMAVLSNETDMLNWFSTHGWEVVRISDIKIMNYNYTQYLFSKEIVK